MDNSFTSIILPIIIGVSLLLIEYFLIAPLTKTGDSSQSQLFWSMFLGGSLAIITSVAIIYGFYQVWPMFSLAVMYSFSFIFVLFAILFLHNLVYRVTFLVIKFKLQYFSGDFNGAIQTLNRIIEFKPLDTYPIIQLAEIYLSMEDYSSALSYSNQAMTIAGERSDILDIQRRSLWGRTYSMEEDQELWNELSKIIGKMISLNPGDSDLVCELAEVYFYMGKRQLGVNKLDELVENLSIAARSLEEENKYLPARRKLWSIVEVQKKVIDLQNYVLSESREDRKMTVPRALHRKLESLAKALCKVNEVLEVIEIYTQLVDIFYYSGRFELGTKVIDDLVNTLKKKASSSGNQHPYRETRQMLWKIVDLQNSLINVQRTYLVLPRSSLQQSNRQNG